MTLTPIAQPNYVTDHTETSAIHKAVQASRHDIIQRLISLGADVDMRDAQGRFPLFYASSHGDTRAVHQLITAGARPDDGSLHEAARELNMGIVMQLVAAGHSPNAPGEHHGGRTALAELCLHAKPEGRQWESKARKVMDVLLAVTPVERKYQNLESAERKNLLHLAIDNPAGFEVVRCLLSFPQVWQNLNSDEFLFEDSSSICYSPTKYVQHFYIGTEDGAMKQNLIKLLKSRNCEDRYFKLRGAQPQGYIGLPKFMLETDQRNMIEYQKHQEDMKRIRERAELEIDLSNRLANTSLRQDQDKHTLRLKQAADLEAIENSKRMNLLEYSKQSADQQLSLDTARWLTEHDHAERRRQAEISQASRMSNIKTEGSDRQARIQERLLDRGDESVRRRGEEYRQIMDRAARHPGIAPPQMPNLLTEGPD
jgi:ankyrin repeat domain-containing protein 50